MQKRGLGLLLGMVAVAAVPACCAIATKGVAFGGQTNIIVWDPAAKVQHFVRVATFESESEELGFIAPTPTVPELEEADEAAFEVLERLKPAGLDTKGFEDNAKSDEPMASLEVIQVKDVAGFRATTLAAKDSAALAKWMKKNGYRTNASVEAWTKFYIKKGWYLTAFRVTEKPELEFQTGSVRMSFKTDRPFNPYYVPSDNLSKNGARLRLYFVAPGDFRGTVGTAYWRDPNWEADVPVKERGELAGHLRLKSELVPPDLRVAAYDDPTFATGATDDIYFKPYQSPPPYGLILLTVAAGGSATWFLFRRMAMRR